jgi:hypothetical protein
MSAAGSPRRSPNFTGTWSPVIRSTVSTTSRPEKPWPLPRL